jgi:hypothetical protein
MTGDLGPERANWLFLGILYKASAKSAALFKIISCTVPKINIPKYSAIIL